MRTKYSFTSLIDIVRRLYEGPQKIMCTQTGIFTGAGVSVTVEIILLGQHSYLILRFLIRVYTAGTFKQNAQSKIYTNMSRC